MAVGNPGYQHAGQALAAGLASHSTGYINSPAAPPQPGAFEVFEKRLDQSNDVAALLTQRIQQLADRLLGSRPQAVQEGGKDVDRTSALARLDAAGTRLDYWLSSASEELARLERL